MSSAPVAALVVLLTLVAVLLTSGVAKLRDRRATRDAFTALRVPDAVPADSAARALPWVEVGLAALLLLAPGRWLAAVAAAALLLLLAYTWLVARALGFDEAVSCSCFGSLGRHDVDLTTLARNVLLSSLAALTVSFGLDGGSAPAALRDLDGGGWAALLATMAAAAVAVLVVGGPAAPDRRLPGEGLLGEELLDYERQAIPYGWLRMPGGRTASLVELSTTRARLLVVLNPGCGPCVRTADKLDQWAAELGAPVGVVAVYPDEASAATAPGHAPELSAWEPELNVRRVFSVGTPAAILLGADGFLAGGPVTGERDIAAFVDEVLAAVAEQPSGPTRS